MIFKNILVLVFYVVASISSLQASSLLKDTRQLSKRLYSIFIPPRDTQRTPKLVSGYVDFLPGPQAEMILNRPAVGNAISAPMAFDMHNILAYCETDSSIKEVVIKSSSPNTFSAGGDIHSIIHPLL